jgi:hypothetical protein
VEQRRPCPRESETVWNDLLLELIGELSRAVDPVPPLVEATARAVFKRGIPKLPDSECP